MTNDQTSLRPLPLREQHVALGARFGEFSGWEMPLWYGGAVEEHMAVRNNAGVFDISHMGRFLVEGADAGELLASLYTRDPRRLAINASAYGFSCNDSGGIIDDLILYRRGDDAFLVICNAANAAVVGDGLVAAVTGKDARLTNLTDAGTTLLAVQGPKAVDIIARILGEDVRQIARRTSGDATRDGRSFFLARTGYTGEDGFEVMASAEDGTWLLSRLVEAGVTPAGLACRDTLRLEAALALHGHDIDDTTNPFEAGLGWAVELDHEFRGRDALVAAKENVTRRLLCILADGPGVMRAGSEIYAGDERIGVLASGGHSPVLGKSIGMGYLPRSVAREGASLSIDVRGRRIPAHTVKRPFYSPPTTD
ncbi:MAG: glycine cleavage system aminomethyltransferase GcvT [Dehalococcoidia bacterium]